VPRLTLTPQLLGLIADRFKVLAEPARLAILERLRRGERTVSELVSETGLGQANVSKHLQMLRQFGFVERRREGSFVYYALADRRVERLCEIMCDRLEAEARDRRKALA
jgi:DNA-binding transcriptional ArsR family regulator